MFSVFAKAVVCPNIFSKTCFCEETIGILFKISNIGRPFTDIIFEKELVFPKLPKWVIQTLTFFKCT